MAELQKRGVQLVVEGQSAFFGDLDKANRAVNGFGDATHKSAGRVSGASEIMTGALRHIGTIAINAMFEAGRAVVGFVSDSVSAAGDFESGMNRFSAAAGDSLAGVGLDLKDFRDLFLEIGKELPVSTAEVQEAAIELVKGGLDPAILAAGGLKDAIQFAAAAELDLVSASEIAIKQLGVWTDATATAEEQTRFLAMSQDLMVKAAGASTLGVEDLAAGMNNAGGQARALNLDYRDFVTSMALISPAFSSAQQAGTGFNVFLKQLQPSTAPAAEAMQELGLFTEAAGSAFFDAEGKYIGTQKAADLLRVATEGLTDAKKAELLQTIFGIDGMVAANTLINAGAEGYDILAQKIEGASGVSEAAAARQQGYNTALDNAKGSAEALQITIGSALLPVLTSLLNDVIAPGINVLTDLAGALSGDQEAFSRLSPTMQSVANTIVEVWDAGNQLLGWFQSASNESSELGGVLTDLGGIWQNLLGVIDAVADGYEAIISAVLPIVESFIEEHGTEIDAFFQETYDTIIEIINTALALYKAIVPPVLKAIAEFIATNGKQIGEIVEGVWKAITGIIDIALTLIKGILQVALALIKGDWEGAWEIVQETASRIWEDIKQIIDGNVQAIGGLIDIFVGYITGMPGRVSGVGEAVMNTIWDGMKAVWQEIVDWVYEQLQWFEDQMPGSEPKDPSSPLRGLKQRGAAIMGNLMEGMQMAPLTASQPMIAPPAITMPRPTVQLIQPANVNNSTTTTNNYGAPPSDTGLSSDHLFALLGSRG